MLTTTKAEMEERRSMKLIQSNLLACQLISMHNFLMTIQLWTCFLISPHKSKNLHY